MTEKDIHIEGIGNIKMQKSDRSRRLSISIKPFKGIKVSIPYRSSFTDAERFVFEKIEWIQKSLDKIKKIEGNTTQFNTETNFSTLLRNVKIACLKTDKIRFKINTNEIVVECPEFINFTDPKVQQHIKKGLTEAMRWEAKHYLPQRTKYLANLHGFIYKEVFIKNALTRWGSCTYDNKINLNLNLIRLPQYLCDHVILHELVHTIHKNHGKNFWEKLEQVNKGSKKFQKELKSYKLLVY